MGIVLADLTRDDRNEFCNWWNWRPTLQLIESSGLIDSDRLERMACNGGGAEISADEAKQLAEFVAIRILPKLRDQDEVQLNGLISDEPRWSGFISEVPSSEMLYGASRKWLEMFVKFCRECDGFTVL